MDRLQRGTATPFHNCGRADDAQVKATRRADGPRIRRSRSSFRFGSPTNTHITIQTEAVKTWNAMHSLDRPSGVFNSLFHLFSHSRLAKRLRNEAAASVEVAAAWRDSDGWSRTQAICKEKRVIRPRFSHQLYTHPLPIEWYKWKEKTASKSKPPVIHAIARRESREPPKFRPQRARREVSPPDGASCFRFDES